VDGEFVGKVASAASGADGINVPDDVGHGYVGCGEFFDETKVAGHPGDRGVVAFGGNFLAAGAADGF
jgi:hypothetical protein